MYLQRFFSPPLTLSKNNWKVFLPPTPCRLDSQSDVEWLFKVEAVKSSPTPWLVVPKVKKERDSCQRCDWLLANKYHIPI